MPDLVPEKLYIVVRDDLPPGQQLAQSVHAAFQLAIQFPDDCRSWVMDSNYLVILSDPSPPHVAARLAFHHPSVGFIETVEPDLPGSPITAVAFLPSPHVTRALSALPLALRPSKHDRGDHSECLTSCSASWRMRRWRTQ